MNMNTQKGFIQLPIIIAILATAAVTTAGFFSYEKFKDYKIKKNEEENKFQEQQEILEQTKQELENLRSSKQTSIVTPSPKKLAPSPVNVESKIDVPVLSAPNTQQANSCIDIRQEYDDFEKIYKEANAKVMDVVVIYGEANSFSSTGLSGISAFKYLYSQATAKKDLFSQNLTELKDLISKLSSLSKDTNNLVNSIKLNYQKGISAYTYAYNLNLDIYKNISESLSPSTIDASLSSLDSANESRKNGYSYFQAGDGNLTTLKQVYNDSLIKDGCRGFCGGGYVLSQGKCVAVKPRIDSLLPTSGTPETTFILKGENFGDIQGNYGYVEIGHSQAKIILWTNTEIRFKPLNVGLSGPFSVVLLPASGASLFESTAGTINILK